MADLDEERWRLKSRRCLDIIDETLTIISALSDGVKDQSEHVAAMGQLHSALEMVQHLWDPCVPDSAHTRAGGRPMLEWQHSPLVEQCLDDLVSSLAASEPFYHKPEELARVTEHVLTVGYRIASELHDLVNDVITNNHLPNNPLTEGLAHFRHLRTRFAIEVERFRFTTRLGKAAEQAESVAEEVQIYAEDSARAAGVVAEGSLSLEFDKLARSEGVAAELFRVLAILLGATVAVYTGIVAIRVDAPFQELLQRFAVGIPVLLLAGFLGREAAQHRRISRWARILGVQLRTINAYGSQLDDERRRELVASLGRRVFDESHPSGRAAKVDETSVVDAEALLARITDLVKVARSSLPGP